MSEEPGRYFVDLKPDLRRWMVLDFKGHEGDYFWLYRRNYQLRMERIGCYQTMEDLRQAARRFWRYGERS
jgi:hypothetical protein